MAQLFELVRSITDLGSSVIFISHDIDEVMEITDRITVLRDGEQSGELAKADATHEKIVEMIVGRSISREQSRKPARGSFPVYARFEGLSDKMLQPSDLHVGKGEILGLTGLIGSGYEEVPYLAFGARSGASGTIAIEDGAPFAQSTLNPPPAIERGFALLPGDRHGESGVDSLSIVDNMFLPYIDPSRADS